MDLINRYIYAVTKKLAPEEREDVKLELKDLINKMTDTRTKGKAATEQDIREVLYELGHPNKLASKYRTNEKIVIGPNLYDSYISVLKIALITTISVLSVIFVIQTIISPMNFLQFFVEYIVSFFTTVIPMAVGWTTVGFMLAQFIAPEKIEQLTGNKQWDPAKLPSVPNPNNKIKRSEAIIAIIVNLIIIIFLSFSNEYFGIWLFDDGKFSGSILFLNENSLSIILPFILLIFSLQIVKELFKLVYERWTYMLFTIGAVINISSIVILFFIKNKLWNDNFIEQLTAEQLITEGTDSFQTVTIVWEQLTFWIIVLTFVGFFIDIIINLIKTRRMNKITS